MGSSETHSLAAVYEYVCVCWKGVSEEGGRGEGGGEWYHSLSEVFQFVRC